MVVLVVYTNTICEHTKYVYDTPCPVSSVYVYDLVPAEGGDPTFSKLIFLQGSQDVPGMGVKPIT